MRYLSFALAIAASLALTASASAAPTKQPAASQPSKAARQRSHREITQIKRVIGPDGRLTFVLKKPIELSVPVPRPRAIFNFNRATRVYKRAPLGTELAKKVLDTVRGAPF